MRSSFGHLAHSLETMATTSAAGLALRRHVIPLVSLFNDQSDNTKVSLMRSVNVGDGNNEKRKYNVPYASSHNRNMSKSKGWTLQSSLLMLWMEKTLVNNQTTIDDK